MKGMLSMRTTRNLVWVVLSLVGLATLSVGVIVYQRAQRTVELPGRVGPTAAPSGSDASSSPNPQELFGREPSDEDVLHLWAKSASTGDYSTAQLYMEDNDTMIGDWQYQHERLVKAIRDYRISNIEVRGQTTRAVVRFDLSTTSHCLDVQVNNLTKRLSVPDPYRDCRAGE